MTDRQVAPARKPVPRAQKLRLLAALRSHPGMVRSHNEDSIAASVDEGLFVLADGMGGYNAGEVASGMATTLLRSELERDLRKWRSELQRDGVARVHALLATRVAQANQAIYHAAHHQPQYEGMGTTLVVAVFSGNTLSVAHLGDSRCYRWRDGRLQQITRDHSLLQEQMDAGLITPEMAAMSRNKSLVTRALGVDPEADLEINDHEVRAGDLYLLCSDGLSDMVEDHDIAGVFQALSQNLDASADALVQMANEAGGRDNISAILVRAEPVLAQDGIVSRFFQWLK
jgi:serine/threonine protein phosphatase PrpC